MVLIERVHTLLTPHVRQVALRMDAGYFAADAALTAARLGMVFAIGIKRNTAVWRAAATVPAGAWVPVIAAVPSIGRRPVAAGLRRTAR